MAVEVSEDCGNQPHVTIAMTIECYCFYMRTAYLAKISLNVHVEDGFLFSKQAHLPPRTTIYERSLSSLGFRPNEAVFSNVFTNRYEMIGNPRKLASAGVGKATV